MKHTVSVLGLPDFVTAERLLGPGDWQRTEHSYCAVLSTDEAADVAARLRGVGLNGVVLQVSVRPPLKRPAVRAGRTRDARLRRDTTPGFERPGVQLDDEGRYSLTPEGIALRMGRAARLRPVTDLGCGVGGNTIGFARAGSTVLAVERDPNRRRMTSHNAAIYGVSDRVHTQAELADDASGDLLFIDPPWGVDWDRAGVSAEQLPLLTDALRRLHSGAFTELWAKLPPSFVRESVPGASLSAVFGERPGDRHRVKFTWLRLVAHKA